MTAEQVVERKKQLSKKEKGTEKKRNKLPQCSKTLIESSSLLHKLLPSFVRVLTPPPMFQVQEMPLGGAYAVRRISH